MMLPLLTIIAFQDFSYSVPVTARIGEGEAAQSELQLRPELEWQLFGWDFEATGVLEADEQEKVRAEDRNRARLSSLTLSRQWEHVAVSLGKQQVVWGQLDGLPVLDVVNPRRYDRFILDADELQRQAQWMAQMEWMADQWELQVLWVADHERHKFPESGEAFAISTTRYQPVPPPGWSVSIQEEAKGNNPVSDGDLGMRLTTYVGNWDLSFNYLYKEDDQAAIGLSLDPVAANVDAIMDYGRYHLFGGTASTSWGDWVARVEYAWFKDRQHSSYTPQPLLADEFDSGIGLDYAGFTDTFISVQFVTRFLSGAPGDLLLRDKEEHTVTLKFTRTWRNETITFDLLAVSDTREGDGLIRPRLDWEVNDRMGVFLGYDYFHGDPNGLYGQFDANDGAYAGATYNF